MPTPGPRGGTVASAPEAVSAAPAPAFAHVREWLLDGLGLALFMVSACVFAVLLEWPGSPVHHALPEPLLRRALMGLAMGATLVANVQAPWGRRSGAHFNPAFTLAFWRLGRVRTADLLGYAVAQAAGAVAGVALAAAILGAPLADPHVHHVVTRPGPAGVAAAFAAEVAIAFALASVVFRLVASPAHAGRTPWVAGALLAAWITFESPLSGTSMNPARSLGSALVSGDWTAFAIYLVAPPLAFVAAAETWRFTAVRRRAGARGCAKLLHRADEDCHFCGQRGRGSSGTRDGVPAFPSDNRSRGPSARP